MHGTDLSAPEAVLLVFPGVRTATACMQAGLLALVAAGRLEPVGHAGKFRLAQGGGAVPGHVGVVGEALGARGEVLDGPAIAGRLQARFGSGFERYVHDAVAPALVGRGLLERRDIRWLGLVPRTRYVRTAAGDAVAEPLWRLAVEAKRVPKLMRDDPEDALRVARAAGALLLVHDDVRRRLPGLRRMADEANVPLLVASSDGSETKRTGAAAEFGVEWNADPLFAAFEAVEALAAAGDGASDGGGDGGGD